MNAFGLFGFSYSGGFRKPSVRPGQKVVFGLYAGVEIPEEIVGVKNVLVMREEEILYVMEAISMPEQQVPGNGAS